MNESEADTREMARSMREFYTALILEGFNEAQAEHLTGKMLEGLAQR